MLSLEAIGLDRVKTEASVQYVDHNLLQIDNLNPDDHLFLESACRRFGVWYSRPGNGISHVVHMQRFGKPGKSLLVNRLAFVTLDSSSGISVWRADRRPDPTPINRWRSVSPCTHL